MNSMFFNDEDIYSGKREVDGVSSEAFAEKLLKCLGEYEPEYSSRKVIPIDVAEELLLHVYVKYVKKEV